MTSFAYESTAADEIVSNVTHTNEFLHTPSQEIRTRDYERTTKKLIAHELHSATLAEYYRTSRIPRGLRSHLQSTLFKEKETYRKKFEQILNKCSFVLMVLTIEFLEVSIKETKEEITAIETQLTASLKTEEWTSLKQKTDRSLLEYRKITEERKRSKFLRDIEDYTLNRVYRWTDQNRRPRWHTHRYNQDTASSGSESEHSTSYASGAFLGDRNRRRGRPQIQGGRGRSMPDYYTGVVTRSQAT